MDEGLAYASGYYRQHRHGTATALEGFGASSAERPSYNWTAIARKGILT